MDNERHALDFLAHGDGIAPVFTASDMAILKARAEKARVQHIPNKVLGIVPYAIKAFNIAVAYKRKEIIWENMNRAQREFILKIKDSLEKK